MLTIYNTFHLVNSQDGILLVSTKGLNEPFVIAKNERFNFLVIHAGETIYDIPLVVKNFKELDLWEMTTYWVDIENKSYWAVAIPFKDKTIDPSLLYQFSSISSYKIFSRHDFPNFFETYKSLCVITGIPE